MGEALRKLPGPETEAQYGADFAAVYDDLYADLATDQAVQVLAKFAGGDDARLLELGAGTGRLAIPLARQGLRVVGVDVSEAMLAVLGQKYRAANLDVRCADMCDLEPLALGKFNVIVVAFNSLLHLNGHTRQQACLRTIRDHLSGNGFAFIEISSMNRLIPGGRRSLQVRGISRNSLVLRYSRHDRESNRILGCHIVFSVGGLRRRRFLHTYLSLAGLDYFADYAGLRLVDRWADWLGTAHSEASLWSISVYSH